MKQLLVLLLLFSSTTSVVLGQNWQPINAHDQWNYQTTNDTTISNTIWVDSVAVNGLDSIFYLNRQVTRCDTCTASTWDSPFYHNQERFLGTQITKQGNKYTLSGNENLILYPYAPVGFEWILDSLQQVSAAIVELKTAIVFDTLDSIKVIVLSNVDTLLLSKSFGIIQFPNPDQTAPYQLVGINNRELGKTVPTFREIYDFEVGDVFEYEETTFSTSTQPGGGTYRRYKQKVVSKTDYGDSIKYEYERVGLRCNISFVQHFYDTSYYAETVSEVFVDSVNHPANAYHNDLVPFKVWKREVEPYWGIIRLYEDETGRMGKLLGSREWENTPSAFYLNPQEERLTGCCLDNYYRTYQAALGETAYNYWIFEVSGARQLLGAIKGTDTIGTVSADGLFLSVPVERNTPAITIFPNPSTNYLSIEMPPSWVTRNKTKVSIKNMKGQEVVYSTQLSNPIDITHLEPGIYFVSVLLNQKTITRKMIKE